MKARETRSTPAAHPARLQFPVSPRRRHSVWRDREPRGDAELEKTFERAHRLIAKAQELIDENERQLAAHARFFTALKAFGEEYKKLPDANPEFIEALQTLICLTNPNLK